jgi:sugar phosphate permease
VVQNHGWTGFFTALLAACGAALALLTLVSNAQSFQQREAAKAKAA